MDRDLVERARRGDQEAFAELVHQVSDTLYGVARRILRDPGLAEDVLQNALVTIWRKLPGLREADRFEGWAYRVLVNASYALPLAQPEGFDALWTRIVDSLRPDGRFSGQLFGVNDDWARSGVVVKSRAEVEAMLAPFEIERLQEFDGEDTTAIGSRKHWHVFHVVARKR